MSGTTATALRRGAMVFAAVVATLVAHSAADGHVLVSLLTPFVAVSAAGAVAAAAMVGSPPDFRAWGPVRMFGTLGALQLIAHGILAKVPWMFGIGGHVHDVLLSPTALAWHVAAAGALTIVLLYGQRLLERAVRVLVAMLGPARRLRMLPRPVRVVRPVLRLVPTERRGRPRLSRGPPSGRTLAV